MKDEPIALELDAPERFAGFRLHRLEVFNWGTFDGRVWVLRTDGRNALLTGDIGSGKSTLVDAVTTLLVPSQRVAYNKAAGADARERTLRSYVLGHYKAGRADLGGAARPVALRESSSYSVILAVFRNAGYDQVVTLAQVFWMKDPHGQPARLYAVADRELSVAGDFADFGTDVARLRKRLRGAGVTVEDSFPPYGALLRRMMGIKNEQALELFHQTVSMKSVGSLTDFVRQHMLEPFDVAPRVQALITHFDDLNRAHEAVLKAKRQLELLVPLTQDCELHEGLVSQVDQLRVCREALKPYYARLKAELVASRLAHLADELAKHASKLNGLEAKRAMRRDEERELRRAMAENGGDRLERLAHDIERKEKEKQGRLDKHRRYDELRQALGLLAMDSEADFLAQRQVCAQLREAAEEREAAVQNELTELGVAFAQGRQENDLLEAEIASLAGRRSNVDAQQIAMRAALCEALDLPEQDMPFAGEMIQVRDSERDWEGAAERLLRGFGLSLLVPDRHYAPVSDWVDRTHLKGRLVYFRVRKEARRDLPTLHPDSLVHKLELKPDSPFATWMAREVSHRFDVACCISQEQFRRETRAITRSGQVKAPGERHEKDDRRRIDDRSRYVLGWSNAAKLDALRGKRGALQARLAGMGERLAGLQLAQRQLRERAQALGRLEEYRDFAELDWQGVAAEIARLQDERRALEAASDTLKTLAQQLEAVEAALIDVDRAIDDRKDQRSRAMQRQSDAQALLAQLREVTEAARAAKLDAHFPRIEALCAAQAVKVPGSVEGCDPAEQELRKWLQDRIDAEEKRLQRLREKIVKAMAEYKEAFKLDTQDVDASLDAAHEYRTMADALRADDLPRFEQRFKELLNENTIREVANFQSQLSREREQIKERIAHINQSLTQIDYNAGRFIEIEAQATSEIDVRDFQDELRSCTEGALTGSEDAQYSEAKFLQVKRIIERLRGREGSAEMDRRWAARVTDVRHWFTFAASERWRSDGSEHEHYSDSGGKSGGQKEKLAYTILAASLAYQFGLEWGAQRSRSFRFVVIDEAFGRGSDESARFGLELFRQLNLQLLIVTPLQKIHIIEPYVANVGFVHNEDGRASRLRNLSIDDYRAERDARG